MRDEWRAILIAIVQYSKLPGCRYTNGRGFQHRPQAAAFGLIQIIFWQ
jgi:hypothetical protein